MIASYEANTSSCEVSAGEGERAEQRQHPQAASQIWPRRDEKAHRGGREAENTP